jgi:2-polyprenyl-3-methyl-5-hydroxy-6-metoxy-1,4-benzoquinol methylase
MDCRLCGTRGLPLFYTQGDRDQYHFFRCPRCRLVVYDTRAGVNQEKYILRAVDPTADTRQNRGHRQTYAFIRRHARPPGRMLDLGCGDGTVLWLARADGWDVEGVELYPEHAAMVRRALGFPVTASDIDSYQGAAGRWDVVILIHVLEHLPDPVQALVKIRSLLSPRGIGVLEFPNIDALDARVRRLLSRTGIHRHRYAPTYTPGHVQEFCRASFAFACDRAGLELLEWETYAVSPVKYALYRLLPIGNKARVLVRPAR